MAYCKECQTELTNKYLLTKSLICPGCDQKLMFDKKEYKNVTRPGVFIVLLFMFNITYTVDIGHRAIVSGCILILWFIFILRYFNYLKKAVLEVKRND